MSWHDCGGAIMTAPYEHGGQIHRVARSMGIRPEDVLDFSSSLNPLGPPEGILAFLREAGHCLAPYPDSDNFSLRQVLARQSSLADDFFLVGNGSTELIYLITRAFRPGVAAIVEPTFSEYERASRLAGAQILRCAWNIEDGWSFPQAAMGGLKEGSISFLCNPNNPSGTVIARKSLEDMVGAFPGTLFVVDEAFIDFLPKPEVFSVQGLCAGARNLIVLRSFTKFYAMAGLRLGYVVAHPSLISKLQAYKEPWSVNALAQEAGELVLRDHAFAQRSRQWIRTEREWLTQALGQTGLRAAAASEANFLLVKIMPEDFTAGRIHRRLEDRGILVRDASNFRGLSAHNLRIAVKSRAENERLLLALHEMLRAAASV